MNDSTYDGYYHRSQFHSSDLPGNEEQTGAPSGRSRRGRQRGEESFPYYGGTVGNTESSQKEGGERTWKRRNSKWSHNCTYQKKLMKGGPLKKLIVVSLITAVMLLAGSFPAPAQAESQVIDSKPKLIGSSQLVEHNPSYPEIELLQVMHHVCNLFKIQGGVS